MKRVVFSAGFLLAGLQASGPGFAKGVSGKVSITVVDRDTGKQLPCRIHVKDSAGKPRRAPDLPFWHDHFVCPGAVQMKLPAGKYTLEIERGPEYPLHSGSFTIAEGTDKKVGVKLKRLVDMAREHWWPGELHVHRPVSDIELLMRAEDLYVAPVITWWNKHNLWSKKKVPAKPLVQFDGSRYYHVMAGEDERQGGALLYFNLGKPLAIAGAGPEYPSPLKFVAEARRHKGVWIDIEKPFWWDMPAWVASGQVDSIGLANNHMCRREMSETEAWGKPRAVKRLPAPLGNGFWSQEIYYHLLNCGIRLPPSAGSASGVLPNPVGYNRVYVYVEKDFDYARWWQGLREGRSFVTNGPLLRVRAAGQLPGHVFSRPEGKVIRVGVQVKLSSRDPIRRLEIVKNGRVERRVPFDEWSRTGSLGTLKFRTSGWFLVRVIAENKKTFRFASTAPYFVEIGKTRRRISKTSARFFMNWVKERVSRVKLEDPAQRREVLRYHARAEDFWQALAAKANVE
jgi:hypothetical protein